MSLIKVPSQGSKIVPNLATPDNPIIPFIEGDGIGVDITPVMQEVVDAAVQKAYGGARKIHWMEIYCGEKAARLYGNDTYLPQETLDVLREYVVSIKGPLATPAQGAVRSLNAALRQQLDMYACLRPVRWFKGVPSPVKRPELVDMVLFRGNADDACTSPECTAASESAKKVIDFLQVEMGVKKIRFPAASSTLVRESKESVERLVRKAIQYAIDHHRKSVTLVYQGSTLKSTECIVRDWAYALAKNEFSGAAIDDGLWLQLPNGIVIKDVISDAFLQQILLRPSEYDVVATLSLNGDYISDALAAEVGGIGIVPGAHLSDDIVCFEATHGTAPKYAGQDRVNPGSIILSAEMMLRHLGWAEAADLIIKGIEAAISDKLVTYDFARLMDDPEEVSCSAFGQAIITRM